MRYVFIKNSRNHQGMDKMLMFFTPCEELNGGSMFSKLAANYNIIQPFVEKIDAHFIEYMNFKIRNIKYYLKDKLTQLDEGGGSQKSKSQNLGSFERQGDESKQT